jgi:hypothetical protein
MRSIRLHASAAALGITVAWAAVVLAAPRIEIGPELHAIVLFGHLAFLVVGLGAVLSVEWIGLLWVLRRRSLRTVLESARTAHTPIWLGLGGLTATGLLLKPDVTAGLTQVKLAAVLLLALNGLYAARMERRIDPSLPLKRGLVARLALATAVSQLCWWAATGIGYLNAR